MLWLKYLDQVLVGVLAEHMDNVAAEGDPDLGTVGEAVLLIGAEIDGGQDHDGILAVDVDVHVDGGTHQLGDVNGSVDGSLAAFAQGDVVGTDNLNYSTAIFG